MNKVVIIAFIIISSLFAEESSTYLKLGDRFFKDSLETMALTQYEKYVNSSPDITELPKVYYRIAYIYQHQGELNKALDWYGELLSKFPTSDYVKKSEYARATIFEEKKEWIEAGEEFYTLWKKFKTAAEARDALFRAANSYGNGGDFPKAIELYELYLSNYPSSDKIGEVLFNEGNLLISQEKYTDAKKSLDRVNKFKISNTWKYEIHYLQALILTKQGDIENSKKILSQLVGNDFSSKYKALLLYAKNLAATKEYKKGWGLYKNYSKITKSIPYEETLFWAELAFDAKDSKSSVSLLNGALADSSADSSYIYYSIAKNYALQNDFYETVKTLRKVIELNKEPYNNKARLRIAELYFKNGLYTNSVKEYRDYLQHTNENADMVLFRIGKIYQDKLSASEMALREYDKILKWFVGTSYSSKAALEIAKIYEEQQKYSDAVAMYKYLVVLEGDSKVGSNAKNRINYLENYKISHYKDAISLLTSIAVNDSLSSFEKRVDGAKIYSDYIKDRYNAIDILSPLLTDTTLNSNQKGKLYLLLAENWKDLNSQYDYENNSEKSKYSKEKAKEYFEKILSDSSMVAFFDKVRFEEISISDSLISNYKKFLEDFPNSIYSAKAFFQLGYEQLKVKDTLLAAQSFESAYKLNDKSISRNALLQAIATYIDIDSLDKAHNLVESYKTTYLSNLKDEDINWLQALLAQKSNNLKDAEKGFSYIVDNFPLGKYGIKSRLNLAEVELSRKEYKKAFNNFTLVESQLSSGEDKGNAIVGIVTSLYYQGYYDNLIKVANENIGNKWLSSEQVSDLYYYKGRAYLQDDQKYKAMSNFNKAIANKSFSKRNETVLLLANVNYDLQEYRKSSDFYAMVRGKFGGNDSIYVEKRYLTSSILAGNIDKITEDYKSFKTTIGKEHPAELYDVIFAEGLYYYRSKNYGNAEKRFSYIVKKSPSNELTSKSSYYLALIDYDQSKYDKAIEKLNNFVTNYKESELVPSAEFVIASIYHKQDKLPEAAKKYQEVAGLKKCDNELKFRALVNASIIYQKLSIWDIAASLNEEILNDFGNRIDKSSYALKTGFAYLKANKVTLALKYFEMANENPAKEDKPEIAYWIAKSKYRLGKYDDALEEFLKISYLYRNEGKWGVTADFEAAKIYEQKGEFNKAKLLFTKIVKIEGENSPIGSEANSHLKSLTSMMEE